MAQWRDRAERISDLEGRIERDTSDRDDLVDRLDELEDRLEVTKGQVRELERANDALGDEARAARRAVEDARKHLQELV